MDRKDVVKLFQGIMKTLDHMRLDMANFMIQQAIPAEQEASGSSDYLICMSQEVYLSVFPLYEECRKQVVLVPVPGLLTSIQVIT